MGILNNGLIIALALEIIFIDIFNCRFWIFRQF